MSMSEDEAREKLRNWVREHHRKLEVAAIALCCSVAHLSHALTGRKRMNDRMLAAIGLRRVERLEVDE